MTIPYVTGDQLKEVDELANANLIRKADGYYLKVVTFTDKSKIKKQDLYDLYKHMTKLRTVNEVSFGKKAKQHLRDEKHFREGIFRFKGFEIGWQYDDMDGLREYVENRSKNNVVAMKKG